MVQHASGVRKHFFGAGVIGQGQCFGQMQAGRTQHREKTLWPCDAGQSPHGLGNTGPLRQCLALPVGTQGLTRQQPPGLVNGLAWRQCGNGQCIAHCGGLQQQGGSAWPGFAQGACRQQPAIANAAFVHHADFTVARQGQMLQTVITNQQLGAGILTQQAMGSMQTIGANNQRYIRVPLDQQRLVTGQCGRGFCGHRHTGRRRPVAAMPAGKYAGFHAQFGKVLHHGNGGGCFACSARYDIANDQHGNGQVRRICLHGTALAPAPRQGIQLRQRPQQAGRPAAPLPDLRQRAMQEGAQTRHGAIIGA